MKNKIFILFLLLLCACATARGFDLPAPTKDQFIYFTADEVTYDQNKAVAALKGNVAVYIDDKGQRKRISANEIQIFTKEQILISQGPTSIEDESGVFTAEDIHFDLASRRLIMKEISADFSPIRVLSVQSMESENGRYILRRAALTCCDKATPHYVVRVGKADIIPGDRIWAYNALVKIGSVPVFWLPVLYRSLNNTSPLTTYIDFTQSNNTGFGVLTSTVYTKNNFRLTGNADYYMKSGLGYGIETAYNDPQRFRGALQAYTIRDNNKDGEQRWGVNGGYWWQVHDSSDSLNNNGGAIYFSQMEIRDVSDPDFNDDFFRSNPYAVSPDKVTRLSVARQSRVSMLRLTYSNYSLLNPDDRTYSNAVENLPQAALIFTPFTIKELGGIVNNVSFTLNNTRIEDYDFVQYMQGRWVVSRDFKPHRNFTLTPSTWYDQQIILRDPTNNDEDKFVARYGGQLNLRSDFITGLLDVGYRFEKRSTSGSLTTDTDAFDKGEESNLIYIQNYYMIMPSFYFRAASGYNLRNSLESWDIEDRIEPVVAEVGYNVAGGAHFFAQNVYDPGAGNQAFVLNGTFRDLAGNLVNLGAANYSDARNTFLFTTKFMLAPKGRTWRADMGIDFSASDNVWHAYSKHIRFTKDFHDFSIMAGVRDRNQNLSFTLRLNILCGKREQTPAGRKIDEFWYPWRAEGLVRDNF